MRKLPLLLVLLLASLMLLAAAASAHAVSLPAVATVPPFVSPEDDEAEADDGGAGEGEGDSVPVEEVDDESEDCEGEEDEACEEGLELEEAEECVLEDASASFTATPGAGQVRLRVHYRAFAATEVVVDARLRGTKGALHLGTDRARFHRAGVFHYSFDLGDKQMAKAVAAKDLEVDLYAVGTPADCEIQLASRAPHRAK
jgi:hypothetical protein